MSNYIKSIHTWLSNNSLSLNPNKTETIFLHLHFPRSPLTVPPCIMVNNHNILYSDNVKYFGIYFDSSLSFHRHISNLLRSINFHIHSFRLIRHSTSLSVSILSPHLSYNRFLITAIFSFSPCLAIKYYRMP